MRPASGVGPREPADGRETHKSQKRAHKPSDADLGSPLFPREHDLRGILGSPLPALHSPGSLPLFHPSPRRSMLASPSRSTFQRDNSSRAGDLDNFFRSPLAKMPFSPMGAGGLGPSLFTPTPRKNHHFEPLFALLGEGQQQSLPAIGPSEAKPADGAEASAAASEGLASHATAQQQHTEGPAMPPGGTPTAGAACTGAGSWTPGAGNLDLETLRLLMASPGMMVGRLGSWELPDSDSGLPLAGVDPIAGLQMLVDDVLIPAARDQQQRQHQHHQHPLQLQMLPPPPQAPTLGAAAAAAAAGPARRPGRFLDFSAGAALGADAKYSPGGDGGNGASQLGREGTQATLPPLPAMPRLPLAAAGPQVGGRATLQAPPPVPAAMWDLPQPTLEALQSQQPGPPMHMHSASAATLQALLPFSTSSGSGGSFDGSGGGGGGGRGSRGSRGSRDSISDDDGSRGGGYADVVCHEMLPPPAPLEVPPPATTPPPADFFDSVGPADKAASTAATAPSQPPSGDAVATAVASAVAAATAAASAVAAQQQHQHQQQHRSATVGPSSTPATLQRPQRTRIANTMLYGTTGAGGSDRSTPLLQISVLDSDAAAAAPSSSTDAVPASKRTSGTGAAAAVTASRSRRSSDSGAKSCRCKKSQCLKLYCDCFAAGQYCGACSCASCQNRPEHKDKVAQRREDIAARDPQAFTRKIQDAPNGNGKHKRGCNCRRSHCLKKYCECYQGGVKCGMQCKCLECENLDVAATVPAANAGNARGAGKRGSSTARTQGGGGGRGSRASSVSTGMEADMSPPPPDLPLPLPMPSAAAAATGSSGGGPGSQGGGLPLPSPSLAVSPLAYTDGGAECGLPLPQPAAVAAMTVSKAPLPSGQPLRAGLLQLGGGKGPGPPHAPFPGSARGGVLVSAPPAAAASNKPTARKPPLPVPRGGATRSGRPSRAVRPWEESTDEEEPALDSEDSGLDDDDDRLPLPLPTSLQPPASQPRPLQQFMPQHLQHFMSQQQQHSVSQQLQHHHHHEEQHAMSQQESMPQEAEPMRVQQSQRHHDRNPPPSQPPAAGLADSLAAAMAAAGFPTAALPAADPNSGAAMQSAAAAMSMEQMPRGLPTMLLTTPRAPTHQTVDTAVTAAEAAFMQASCVAAAMAARPAAAGRISPPPPASTEPAAPSQPPPQRLAFPQLKLEPESPMQPQLLSPQPQRGLGEYLSSGGMLPMSPGAPSFLVRRSMLEDSDDEDGGPQQLGGRGGFAAGGASGAPAAAAGGAAAGMQYGGGADGMQAMPRRHDCEEKSSSLDLDADVDVAMAIDAAAEAMAAQDGGDDLHALMSMGGHGGGGHGGGPLGCRDLLEMGMMDGPVPPPEAMMGGGGGFHPSASAGSAGASSVLRASSSHPPHLPLHRPSRFAPNGGGGPGGHAAEAHDLQGHRSGGPPGSRRLAVAAAVGAASSVHTMASPVRTSSAALGSLAAAHHGAGRMVGAKRKAHDVDEDDGQDDSDGDTDYRPDAASPPKAHATRQPSARQAAARAGGGSRSRSRAVANGAVGAATGASSGGGGAAPPPGRNGNGNSAEKELLKASALQYITQRLGNKPVVPPAPSQQAPAQQQQPQQQQQQPLQQQHEAPPLPASLLWQPMRGQPGTDVAAAEACSGVEGFAGLQRGGGGGGSILASSAPRPSAQQQSEQKPRQPAAPTEPAISAADTAIFDGTGASAARAQPCGTPADSANSPVLYSPPQFATESGSGGAGSVAGGGGGGGLQQLTRLTAMTKLGSGSTLFFSPQTEKRPKVA